MRSNRPKRAYRKPHVERRLRLAEVTEQLAPLTGVGLEE